MSHTIRPNLETVTSTPTFIKRWILPGACGLTLLTASPASFAAPPPIPEILKNPIVTQIDKGLIDGTLAAGLNGGIPTTTMRDQNAAEDCWAFMATSWMESHSYLMETQNGGKAEPVSVSPEHFLFWHVYDSVQKHLGDFEQLAKEMQNSPDKTKHIESAFGLISDKVPGRTYFQPNVGNNQTTFLPELKKYGVVPKGVYPVTLTAENKELFLEKQLKLFVADLLVHPELIKQYEGKSADGVNERLYNDLSTGFKKAFKASPLRPQASFTYRGKEYSPATFMTNRMRFDPAHYVNYTVSNRTKAAQEGSINAIAQSLIKSKVGVPIGISILDDKGDLPFSLFKRNGIFTAEFCAIHPCTTSIGGHEILIVNFIYEGDPKIGYQTGDKVVAFVIKNSWGESSGRDVNGKRTDNKNDSGYYVITADYLDLLVKHPKFQGWDFTLPLQDALQLQDQNKLRLELIRGAGRQSCKELFK